jgi:hypothetical protein
VRYQVLAMMSMKMAVFWDIVPCSLVNIDQCFRGTKLLWNVSQYLPDYTVQVPEDSHLDVQILLYKVHVTSCKCVRNKREVCINFTAIAKPLKTSEMFLGFNSLVLSYMDGNNVYLVQYLRGILEPSCISSHYLAILLKLTFFFLTNIKRSQT